MYHLYCHYTTNVSSPVYHTWCLCTLLISCCIVLCYWINSLFLEGISPTLQTLCYYTNNLYTQSNVHICIYTYICICMYICTYVYVCTYVHMYMYWYVHMYMSEKSLYKWYTDRVIWRGGVFVCSIVCLCVYMLIFCTSTSPSVCKSLCATLYHIVL